MRTDGQTDGWTNVTKLTVAFGNFANAPKSYMLKNTKFVNVQQAKQIYHITAVSWTK